MQPLLCRPYLDELPQGTGEKVPTGTDVVDEALGLVLGQDRDAADSRIDAVRQGEVDIAEVPAESDGRLALPPCQLSEAGAVTTGEDQCDCVLLEPHTHSVLCSHRSGVSNKRSQHRTRTHRAPYMNTPALCSAP